VDGIEWGGTGNSTIVRRNHIILETSETGCVNEQQARRRHRRRGT
jgi:hypothetical protein